MRVAASAVVNVRALARHPNATKRRTVCEPGAAAEGRAGGERAGGAKPFRDDSVFARVPVVGRKERLARAVSGPLGQLPRPARRAAARIDEAGIPARHERCRRTRQADGDAEQQLCDPAEIRRRRPQHGVDHVLLERGRRPGSLRPARALRPVQRPLARVGRRRSAARDLDHLLRDLGHGRPAGQLASVRDRRRSDRRDLGRLSDHRLQQGGRGDRRQHVRDRHAHVRARPSDRARLRRAAGRWSGQSGRHQRPGRLRAPARDHEFADREDAVRGRARREHGRDVPAVVARRQDVDPRRRRGQGESARHLDVARAGERPAATDRPGNRPGRLPDRRRRLPQRSHLLRADVRDAGRRPRRLRPPLRRPVGRDRHARQLRPGRTDRGRVGQPLERRPFVRVRDARGERPQRRARRVLGVPDRRLRRRGVRVPGGYRSAEYDPRPGHLQGRGGALRQAATRPEPLGRLQQQPGRSVGRSLPLDAAGVRARAGRCRSGLRALGRLVGPNRRRAAGCPSRMRRAEAARKEPRPGATAARNEPVPTRLGQTHEVVSEQKGEGRPRAARAGDDARRELHGRPLARERSANG